MEKYLQLNNKLNIPEEGTIPLHYDKEAVRAFFLDHVNVNTRTYQDFDEKLTYLINNEFIDEEVISKYRIDFIEELHDELHSLKFRFKSFMGAYKAYRQYIMKDEKGFYVERYEDRVLFNALLMADGDEELAWTLAHEIIAHRYQPATPTFLSAGRKHRGEFVSCFLLETEDNMNSIGRLQNSALQLSKIGGGVGIDLTNLREAGAPIKNIPGAASGVIPVMKILEHDFNYANQLGQRNGAGVVYLNVFHQDILDFLSTRNENAEDSKRIKTLSIGVVTPDIYYKLVEERKTMYLFSAYDASKYYGIPFSQIDFTKEYDSMVDNPEIGKRAVRAEEISTMIGKLQQESGYPYILNIDSANRESAISGKITMSNLCSEILQVQTPSVINDNQSYEVLGRDISCNLGSINIPKFMEMGTGDQAEESILAMMKALTFISDISEVKSVPTVNNGNKLSHAVGLGAMGLHQMLATNKMHYGSDESIEFVDKFFEMINYLTIRASNSIAREKGETFFEFEKSKYATGEYFDKYLGGDATPANHFTSKKVESLFTGFPLPTKDDWKKLREEVKEFGLYNAYRMAVAPNGSISYINETTASLHPIISAVEERQEKKVGKTYYPAPGLSNETLPYYKSAYDISMIDVINIYATAQRHIDQGMSLTLFMRSNIPAGLYQWKPNGGPMSTKDLTLLRHYAWRKGIKSLYYVRTFTQDEQEVGITECESCSI